MNKFQHLTKKLIQNSLWCSTLTYIPRTTVKNGIQKSDTYGETIELKVVVTSVDKNLIDNVNIISTDLQFVVDKLSLSECNITDLIKYNNKIYKIVQVFPIGVLNNDPVGWSIIIRLA